MLARSFMTAADLKISEAQFDGLVKTLRALERKELIHVPVHTDRHNGFNMGSWDCGSTHCILGYARLYSNDAFLDLTPGLKAICYPSLHGDLTAVKPRKHTQDITPSIAARALSNYLTTGHPRWVEAFAD